ncbi:PIN domain-containing protein [Alcaligenes sp. SDU_A2]|uniref:PIN domain-containing protein n=1 Tax=Alcaligenes sp. SDU_A2 TaxID=3136634 RepID=UPI00311FA2B6
MATSLPAVLVLDTCVLISNVLRRLLLAMADAGVFQPAWSPVIGDEWRRNAGRLWKVMPVSIDEQWEQLQQTYPQADLGDATAFKDGLRHSDAKDWHVIATARAAQQRYPGQAVGILTRNIKDFNRSELRRLGLTLWEPDQYLAQCMQDQPLVLRRLLDGLPDLMLTPEAQALDTATLLKRDRLFRLAQLYVQPSSMET